ncbi:hypothetical protein FO519_003163 [Halicephalobus sp. NKZ332]|nr:hypothetical protein FO519_003163 [Halicephalobus sp. NKZ332]
MQGEDRTFLRKQPSYIVPKLSTPRSILGKRKSKQKQTPLPISTERRIPHIDPQYWAPLLKKKIFHHISGFRPPRSHIIDPNEEKPEPPTFPTLKKLKKCGQYVLKWKAETEPSKVDYCIQGNVIPTVAGGVSVVFSEIESTSKTFEPFK